MSGLVVGFLLVTVLVGWVLHPVFAGRAASGAADGAEGGASLRAPGPDPGVESEIAALRARLREGPACGRCGAPVLEADRFCGGCGAPVDVPDGSVTEAD